MCTRQFWMCETESAMEGEGGYCGSGPSHCQGAPEPCIRLVCDSHTRVAYMCRLLIKFLLFEHSLKNTHMFLIGE